MAIIENLKFDQIEKLKEKLKELKVENPDLRYWFFQQKEKSTIGEEKEFRGREEKVKNCSFCGAVDFRCEAYQIDRGYYHYGKDGEGFVDHGTIVVESPVHECMGCGERFVFKKESDKDKMFEAVESVCRKWF